MTPDERELRRALDARSGAPSAEFIARLNATLAEPRRSRRLMPAVAFAAVLVITVGAVGVLLMARAARHNQPGGLATAPRLSSPSPVYPVGIELSVPSESVLWGLVGGQFLYRSLDGGRSWTERPLPGSAPFMHASFIDDHDGWIVSDGPGATQCSFGSATVWRTTDGGASWQQLAQVLPQAASGPRSASGLGFAQCKDVISFLDSRRGFIDAWDDNSPPTIYRTQDGGRTWSGSRLPDPPGFKTYGAGDALVAGQVRAFGEALLVTASGMQPDGMHYYVFRSTDGGATWRFLANTGRPVVLVTASRWLGMQPILADETLDSGRTWHPFPTQYMQAAGVEPQIVFSDSRVGYATVRGSIQRTADGGLTWSMVNSPGT